ncbi:MAG: hypothetical protein Q8S29_02125 [Phreatobacter sp.]|nr:hypothetical protein [Phreatobacter sp.]
MRVDGRRRQTGSGRSGRRSLAATPSAPVSRADIASYVGKLASELVELARLAEFKTLAYLADMVRLEAEQQAEIIREREGGQRACAQSSDTRPPGSR